MENVVSSCNDCPMVHINSEYGDYTCQHPVAITLPNRFEYWQVGNKSGVQQYNGNDLGLRYNDHEGIPPKWCPLRETPLTIRFEGQEPIENYHIRP
jgi:hypothetical protein